MRLLLPFHTSAVDLRISVDTSRPLTQFSVSLCFVCFMLRLFPDALHLLLVFVPVLVVVCSHCASLLCVVVSLKCPHVAFVVFLLHLSLVSSVLLNL